MKNMYINKPNVRFYGEQPCTIITNCQRQTVPLNTLLMGEQHLLRLAGIQEEQTQSTAPPTGNYINITRRDNSC